MPSTATSPARPFAFFRLALCAALLALLHAHAAFAQTATSVTDGATPSALTPGAPSGSYLLSDFESVNLFNGNLNFALPLLRMNGRGEVGASVMLKLERHWRVKTLKPLPNCQLTGSSCQPVRMPDPSGWATFSPDYSPGVLKGRQPGVSCGDLTLTRLTFTAGDGTEYELRDREYGGQPKSFFCSSGGGHHRGAVFVTADGTSATFTSDAVIYDWTGGAPTTLNPSGVLKLKNGTIYRIDGGKVTWVGDRNGNRVSYTYEGTKVKTITDSLGRAVTINYNVSDVQPYGVCDQIIYTGFGGAQRVVRVSRVKMESALRTTRPTDSALPKKISELFPEYEYGATIEFNPTGVVSAVWLPDDGANRRAYRFFYNVYGELARLELPTGGAIEYDFAKYAVNNDGIFRGVVERRVYADGANLEARTAYGNSPSPRTVDTFDASNVLLTRSAHYFHGNPVHSLAQFPTDYSGWREGREYKTEHFGVAGGVASPAPLRRVEQVWRQRAPVSWWTGTAEKEPPNDPRVVETVTTIEPGGANLVTKRSGLNPLTGAVGFDQFNNQTDVWEYDYGVGAAPPYALRHTHTDYLTTNNGVDYTAAAGAHLRDLASAQQVYAVNPSTGAETLAAKGETRYDEPAYPLLGCDPDGVVACASVPQWADPGSARGNPTTSRGWLDTNNTWLEAHVQYDQLGNPRKNWDARGNLSEVSYKDAYCNGTLCGAAGYVPNAFGFPTSTRTPKPDPTGAQGSAAELTGSSVYDFYTGFVYSATDANGKTTRFEYADPLDRPTAQVRPDGGRTDVSYSQPHEPLYVRTHADLDGARRLTSEQHFDRMGRPSRSFIWEDQDAGNPWLTVDTLYDALGRPWRTSSQYRSAGPGSAVDVNRAGTEKTFDALGRVTQVRTTADGAPVRTGYEGQRTLITDQDGRQRIGKTDALGRLTEMWEVTPYDPARYPGIEAVSFPAAGGVPAPAYGFRTSYFYDALGNLRRVKQGSQERFFAYDSLRRLVRAKNPEQGAFAPGGDFPALTDATSGNGQWSLGYAYDANGNLTKRRDARGTTATYGYDALNRNVTVGYTLGGQTAATADVRRYYDNPSAGANGLGRLWKSESAQTALSTVEKYDALGQPKEQTQRFWVGGAWGQPYASGLSYNLAGAVTSQTYPSGRMVNYQYDAAGRIGDNGQAPAFKGTLGDGVERTYASQVLYDELGGRSQERFGTQTPVYNKHFYNVRGQLSEIRVSTHSITNTDQNLRTNWNRGALINHYSEQSWAGSGTDNNGNLRKQDIYIPDNDQISGYGLSTFFYDYDALNRLQKAREGRDGADQWVQQYQYDRWGNRTVDAAATWGAPEPQFSVDAATNRLGVPAGQAGQMSYDPAGNLTHDSYQGGQGGGGSRAYDAEGRMTSAEFLSGQTQAAGYAYDADGRRVKRNVGTAGEVWHVYGAGGRLLAEYAPNAAASSPQKEYGYRGGELLLTAGASAGGGTSAPRVNVAAASGGATATASTAYDAYGLTTARAINGSRTYAGSYWNDQTVNTLPDWLQINFSGAKTIDEVDLFFLQDNYATADPTESMTFTQMGITSFEVQYWTGSAWATVPGGSVTGNNKVWRKLTFAPLTTDKIRVVVNAATDGWSRIVEVEAYQAAPNVAAAASGATAVGSTSYDPYGLHASNAINGNRNYSGSYWNDMTAGSFPDWLQVNFAGSKTIGEVNVFGLQDNYGTAAPTESMTFTQFGLTSFEVQYWTGSAWATVPGGSVSGNNKVWRKFTFAPVTTDRIRVVVNATTDVWSRIVEVEAYEGASSAAGTDLRWLVADQLGTPRMVVDGAGSLSGVSRHDYYPFGEEITAAGGRTQVRGYGGFDGVRQHFTSKERDGETGLDYFGARYYSSAQGRFTSSDPLLSSAETEDPQTWNRYAYVTNNPLKYDDPTGEKRNPVTNRRGIDPIPANGVQGKIRSNRNNPHVGEWGKVRNGGAKSHHGVDINARIGTPLVAPESGKVEEIRYNGDYGNQLVIRTDKNELVTLSHLSGYAEGLRRGDRVVEGNVVAFSGNSGNAKNLTATDEDHVHLEIRDAEGERVSPIEWLNDPEADGPLELPGRVVILPDCIAGTPCTEEGPPILEPLPNPGAVPHTHRPPQ